MAIVESVPPFAHALYRKAGWAQLEMDILAVRGTFAWGEDEQPLKLAPTQRPIRWGEEFAGPSDRPLSTVVASDGDAVIGKPTTDVHLTGALQSPSGAAQPEWLAGVRVGPVQKTLRVCGPRRFERGLMGWRVTRPQAVEAVALDYRQAFGGSFYAWDKEGKPNGAQINHRPNPAGCGWLPTAADLKALDKVARRDIQAQIARLRELPAPQFEAPGRPIRHPHDRHATEGFGPIARWWAPRVDLQGTMDDAWMQHRYPERPVDFDPRFYNSAHPDLIAAKFLEGDEAIVLANCTRHGTCQPNGDRLWRSRLPGIAVFGMSEFVSGRKEVTPFALDTVSIDLDAQEVTLTWRTVFPPNDSLERVTISAMPLDMWRQHRADVAQAVRS